MIAKPLLFFQERNDEVQKAIEKADTLIEAMKWIREHRGKTTVIKIGGSLMDNKVAMMHLLLDAVFMETVGMRPVIVHGGGKAISQAMSDAGIEPRFIQGRRFTDAPSLEIVRNVLACQIPKMLVDEIISYGGQAKAFAEFDHSTILYGKKSTIPDENGEPIDLGFVGTVTRVDTDAITKAGDQGFIPIIPSYTLMDDGSGQGLNVNADIAATKVAKALKADKLVFVSEVNGVRKDPDDPNSMISALTVKEAKDLLGSGSIVGGMIPKIQSCLETIESGVDKIHIINGQIRHSLLMEIFTSQGVGTLIQQKK